MLLVINKIDLSKDNQLEEVTAYWTERLKVDTVIPVSATEPFNTERILVEILDRLPFHPPYYDKEELTDRPERFFASEIIREKIFLNYKKEIPYSTEVAIEEFLEDEKIIRIRAVIFVERNSQKGIMIGQGGKAWGLWRGRSWKSSSEKKYFFKLTLKWRRTGGKTKTN